MPSPYASFSAAEIHSSLRRRLGHTHVAVKVQGGRYLIQLILEDEVETVARLTEIKPRVYGIEFRTHHGRWEPLPDTGSLDETVETLATDLGAYLTPDNY